MSRKHKHLKLNPPPNISMFGSQLDRLLNGVVTSELKKELESGTLPLPSSAESTATPFIPRELPPLYAVFYEDICNCGSSLTQYSFSHLAIKHVTKCANGTEEVRWQTTPYPRALSGLMFTKRCIPFCPSCIPSGLARE
jgi:hypothetical protein